MKSDGPEDRSIRFPAIAAIACSVVPVVVWVGFTSLSREVVADESVDNMGLLVPFFIAFGGTGVFWLFAVIFSIAAVVDSQKRLKTLGAVMLAMLLAVGAVILVMTQALVI